MAIIRRCDVCGAESDDDPDHDRGVVVVNKLTVRWQVQRRDPLPARPHDVVTGPVPSAADLCRSCRSTLSGAIDSLLTETMDRASVAVSPNVD